MQNGDNRFLCCSLIVDGEILQNDTYKFCHVCRNTRRSVDAAMCCRQPAEEMAFLIADWSKYPNRKLFGRMKIMLSINSWDTVKRAESVTWVPSMSSTVTRWNI